MLVYHFKDAEFGLKAIREKRLKVARIPELNDPFELMAPCMSDPVFRSAFLSMRRELSQRVGFVCFSNKYSNPVLWSHYADHHRGVCLGFEIPDKILTKVKYAKERTSPDRLLSKNVSTKFEAMMECLSLKFSHWRYESERRLFVDLNEAKLDKKSGLHFQDFCDHIVLKKVIVGLNSTISRQQIQDCLEAHAPSIDAFKVRPAFKTFNVVKNRKEALWK